MKFHQQYLISLPISFTLHISFLTEAVEPKSLLSTIEPEADVDAHILEQESVNSQPLRSVLVGLQSTVETVPTLGDHRQLRQRQVDEVEIQPTDTVPEDRV